MPAKVEVTLAVINTDPEVRAGEATTYRIVVANAGRQRLALAVRAFVPSDLAKAKAGAGGSVADRRADWRLTLAAGERGELSLTGQYGHASSTRTVVTACAYRDPSGPPLVCATHVDEVQPVRPLLIVAWLGVGAFAALCAAAAFRLRRRRA